MTSRDAGSNVRPVFHSEADLQHALAWQLQEQHRRISIRLEYRSQHLPQRGYLDIWLADGAEYVAIELKYKTRALRANVDGEDFDLLEQSAQDIGRYDTVKDIQRLASSLFYGSRKIRSKLFSMNHLCRITIFRHLVGARQKWARVHCTGAP